MADFLAHYHPVHPTTWVYLSSLMAIALYFKFSRLLSVRNLDVIALICMAPGLLLVRYAYEAVSPERMASVEQLGYTWLFITSGVLLVRLLSDPLMIRRPLLEPNLSVGGQTFVGLSLLAFLVANVITSPVSDDDLTGPQLADKLRARQETPADSLATHGPGYPLLFLLPSISTHQIYADKSERTENGVVQRVDREAVHVATARSMAILSHLAIVLGIVMIGYRHFDNIKTGIAAATLYLMVPYTAQFTGQVHHVLPAALLIWAVVCYRRPLVAGMLMGLAIGVIYYPAFLLPLWIGFYWQRGMHRFLIGVACTLAVLVLALALMSHDRATLFANLTQMFGLRPPIMENLGGFWRYHVAAYRLPVLAAFAAMCASLAIWPAQKNLGTLMSCSAAIMLGTQFWHPQGGGAFVAWYLPLLLLTIFRPNLEDRVALSVLGEGWFPIRRPRLRATEQAA